jgi:hypothetical protein
MGWAEMNKVTCRKDKEWIILNALFPGGSNYDCFRTGSIQALGAEPGYQ